MARASVYNMQSAGFAISRSRVRFSRTVLSSTAIDKPLTHARVPVTKQYDLSVATERQQGSLFHVQTLSLF